MMPTGEYSITCYMASNDDKQKATPEGVAVTNLIVALKFTRSKLRGVT